MIDSSSEWLRPALVAALVDPAAPAEHQLTVLGDALPVDELALKLDDVAQAAIDAQGLLTPRQRQLATALSDRLSAMSGSEHHDLWTLAALTQADEWTQVREQARQALVKLR